MVERNLHASQLLLMSLVGTGVWSNCQLWICLVLYFLTVHRTGYLTKENQWSSSSTIIFKLLACKGPLYSLEQNIFFLIINAALPAAYVTLSGLPNPAIYASKDMVYSQSRG